LIPIGWALANGQLLSISQNTALFALLGTQFGGDGGTTFALPDFRGARRSARTPCSRSGPWSASVHDPDRAPDARARPRPGRRARAGAAAWALMIAGFGLAGAAIRRRRRVAA
jgi:hypothetical protein